MTQEEEDDEGDGRDEGTALSCGGQQQIGRDDSFSTFFPSLDIAGLISEVYGHYNSGNIYMSVCKCVCVS